ncbi:putative transcription factor bHLH041 [Cinnamomum micranthum f. kanehirae]|uniref:Putative transcription factor bHLH041 n=1 Tax=Cinnamomum micranthum f. kanehirae TaxID=337451 RepID=A0A3S3Q3M0_9MAGN|nr:putative transcription factor bHLH041 [Cinnamomum micranthum f. kanehirae]
MDSVFYLEGKALSNFLQSLGQTLGCSYICLWSYLPPPHNVLISKGGWYDDDSNRPSSSAGSFPRSLFDAYMHCICSIENGGVPGKAFKEGLPSLELGGLELLNLASIEIQRQFYQEARIQTAIFNGCRTGVMEIGMSSPTQKNISIEMGKWFPEDFTPHQQLRDPRLPDQSRPSSSSSSLRSLSVGSPEYSSLFDLVSASFVPDSTQEAPIERAIRPTSVSGPPYQLTMQAYSQQSNVYLPRPAIEDAAMTRAMLAVISSPSSSSSSYNPQNPTHRHQRSNQRTAFRAYDSALGPNFERRPSSYSQSNMKRMLALLRTIRPQMQEIRSSSTQLHHMISERKRREKLNESFEALRALLPPGIKKYKASVLSKTMEYLKSLKAQVLELQEKNSSLEASLLSVKEPLQEPLQEIRSERTVVQVVEAPESSSQSRRIELRVIVREEDCEMTDLLLRVLECLKQMQDVSLVSIDADTHLQETNQINRAIFRLQIKASDWNQEAFEEVVTRAIADMGRRGPPI